MKEKNEDKTNLWEQIQWKITKKLKSNSYYKYVIRFFCNVQLHTNKTGNEQDNKHIEVLIHQSFWSNLLKKKLLLVLKYEQTESGLVVPEKSSINHFYLKLLVLNTILIYPCLSSSCCRRLVVVMSKVTQLTQNSFLLVTSLPDRPYAGVPNCLLDRCLKLQFLNNFALLFPFYGVLLMRGSINKEVRLL